MGCLKTRGKSQNGRVFKLQWGTLHASICNHNLMIISKCYFPTNQDPQPKRKSLTKQNKMTAQSNDYLKMLFSHQSGPPAKKEKPHQAEQNDGQSRSQ